MSDETTRLKELFAEALEQPAGSRSAWLEGACRGQPELRRRVDELLAAWQRAEGFLESPTHERADADADTGERGGEHDGPGSTIGPYKLLQTIGEGGMGVVYMAEQERPVRRKVALKIIKLGMDTKQVIGRFEAERQALAMMDHPNIARVLDAGSTASGRPYFVMELVRGVSINEYCDKNALSTRQRLELFVPVCLAIQHAHQKGIIHRDLKPSNVLVTLHDGVPVPKVIDFGIAKATHQRLTERTVFTEFRSFIGTPEYMSPEQAEMSGLDIDTRSDIYSLGVLLYELLTGTTPFDARTLREAAFDELQRIIREQEPPRPSTRLSTLGEAATRIAKQRSLDPAALSRVLRGDLDWIVMKALEKDRTRRYESASELAADVQRHLRSEPVLAGPPGLTYKLRKFVRRNRAAVGTAALVLLLLVGGIVATTRAMLDASRQRALALANLDEARLSEEAARAARLQEEQQRVLAEQAKVEADRQAGEAQRQRALAESESGRVRSVTSFLVETLAFADPEIAPTPEFTVRQMLDRAAARVGGAFGDQPLSEATLRATIGKAYFSLGEVELAQPHLRRAVELWDRHGEADRWELYSTLWQLTSTVFMSGGREIQTVGQRVVLLGLQLLGPDQAELAAALGEMIEGNMTGDLAAGRRGYDDALRLAGERLRPGDARWRIVADDLFACGYASWYFRGNPAAADFLSAALAIYRRELPETHPQTALTMEMLVSLLTQAGEFARAEALTRESIEMRQRALPAEHAYVANAEALLGSCLVGQGRFDEAQAILLASLDKLERGASSQEVPRSALVQLYDAWGRPAEAAEQRAALAEALLRSASAPDLGTLRVAFPTELEPLLAPLEELLAFGQRTQGGAAAADELARDLARILDRLLPLRRELVPDSAPLAALVARELVNWATQWELSTPALEALRGELFDEARSILASWEQELPGDLGWTTYMLARQEIEQGDLERGELMLREALQLVERGFGRNAWSTASVMRELGDLLVGQRRYAEAEPLLLGCYPAFVEQLGERSWDAFRAARTIAVLYELWGRSEEARPIVAAQVAVLRRVADDPPANNGQVLAFADFLLDCQPADLRDPRAALALAEAVYARGGRGWAYGVDLLARARFETGDAEGAALRQREALDLLPAEHPDRDDYEQRLARYRAAGG